MAVQKSGFDQTKRAYPNLVVKVANAAGDYRPTLRESEGTQALPAAPAIKSQEVEPSVIRKEGEELDRANIEILPAMQRIFASLGS